MNGTSFRVLVVDDEPGIVRVIQRVLAGHEVHAVASVDAAIARLEADEPIDAVLCDVMMPGRSGLELHAHVRRHRPELASRFVVVSGGVLSPQQEDYVRAHGVAHLRKPFSPEALRSAVRVAATGVGDR